MSDGGITKVKNLLKALISYAAERNDAQIAVSKEPRGGGKYI